MILCKLSDFELIHKIKEGNYSAFTIIVKRYKPRVASTIHGMIGKCDDAEDIGQDVFIRFYKSIESFRGESSLGTYLTRIAINLTLNEIKRRKIKRFLSFDKMHEEGIDIGAEDNITFDNKDIVQKGIQQLNPKYRTVLVLRLIDDYSTEETAKILNIPVGTVLSRLARAQSKLRKIL